MSLTFEQAVELQPHYRPTNPGVRSVLAGISIAAFCGPTAVGKNYLMRLSGYPAAGTVTTREPRASDTGYRYVDTQQMLEEIEQGRLVQYGTNPDAGTIYASDLQAYTPNSIHCMDVFTDSVEDLSKIGYRVIRPIGVIACVRDWEQRLDDRFAGMDKHQIQSRLSEARGALQILAGWEGHSDKLLVVSRTDLDGDNRRLVTDFAEDGVCNPPSGDILQNIQDMQSAIPIFTKKYTNEDPTYER